MVERHVANVNVEGSNPFSRFSENLAKASVYGLPARPSASPTLNPVRSCAPERKGLHDEQPISASVLGLFAPCMSYD